MTIKDSFDTAGVRSTSGTKGRENFVPKEDATAVARLRQAGAILLGKTNTSELTMFANTANLVFARTNNPYDTAKSPAGSSGGAAAIVAAGGSPLEVGSDTGGSVRGPAHFCGVVGLKPTQGRIPRTGHVISYGLRRLDPLTHIGPLARFVDDLGLLLPILAGPDGRDPATVPMPVTHPERIAVRGLRVAFYTDNKILAPDPQVAEAVSAVASKLSGAGAIVQEAFPPAVSQTMELLVGLWLGDGPRLVTRLLEAVGTKQWHPQLNWHRDPKEQADLKSKYHGKDFPEALEQWTRFCADMTRFISDYDAIICPVNPLASLSHEPDESVVIESYTYTTTYNLTGWPAAVVRTSTSDAGMPIGVQIVAQPWREDVALAVAKFLETEFGGWQPPSL